jgi:hypothetical protein
MDFTRLFDEAGCIGSLHPVRLSDGTKVSHDADRPHALASVVKVPSALSSMPRPMQDEWTRRRGSRLRIPIERQDPSGSHSSRTNASDSVHCTCDHPGQDPRRKFINGSFVSLSGGRKARSACSRSDVDGHNNGNTN